MDLRTHLVISYYDRRSPAALHSLLAQISACPRRPEKTTVVVNETGGEVAQVELGDSSVSVLRRHNVGMNIGAWDAGWRQVDSDLHVFMQDDCYILRNDWLDLFERAAAKPGVGLVGESFNPSWEHSWDMLGHLHAGSQLPEHTIDGKTVPRVELYLHMLNKWGIVQGATGRHLRSLVIAATQRTLSRINGFPCGSSYGECIAAEIGISRAVEAAGLRLVQVGDEPFLAIGHHDWARMSPIAPLTHRRVPTYFPVALDRAVLDHEAEIIAMDMPTAIGARLRELALLRRLSLRDECIRRLQAELASKKRSSE